MNRVAWIAIVALGLGAVPSLVAVVLSSGASRVAEERPAVRTSGPESGATDGDSPTLSWEVDAARTLECRKPDEAGSALHPLTADEVPSGATLRGMPWRMRTVIPTTAEGLLNAPADFDSSWSLNAQEMADLWSHYVRVRSSATVAADHPPNMRLVVAFRSRAGAIRWFAMGRSRALIQTEDHFCHPLDRALFAAVLAITRMTDDVRSSDPVVAPFLPQ